MRQKIFSDQFPVEILGKIVFAKEPLEQDEHIVACWDDSHTFLNLKKYRWKRGGIISNLSLYLWNEEKVQRFHFVKIEDVLNIDAVVVFDDSKVWRFRFRYEKRMIHFSIPANKTLIDAFINRISDGQTTLMRTPAGISYGRCSICHTSFEGIVFPFSLGMNFKENAFSLSDLEKFDCKNLIFFCKSIDCNVPICLKCLEAKKDDGQLPKNFICPTCQKDFGPNEKHLIIVGHYPKNVVTKYQHFWVWKRSHHGYYYTSNCFELQFVRDYRIHIKIKDLLKLKFPLNVCPLCMNKNTSEPIIIPINDWASDIYLGELLFCICSSCKNIINDPRIGIEPPKFGIVGGTKRISNFWPISYDSKIEERTKDSSVIILSFSNADYAKLFEARCHKKS